jgi:lysozyme
MSLSEAGSFVEHIHLKTKQYPILYSGQSFLNETLGETKATETVLSQCPLWIARYSSQQPQLPPAFSDYVLWQYTGDGVGPLPHSVKGISSPVDRDQFNGTIEQLHEFWGNYIYG